MKNLLVSLLVTGALAMPVAYAMDEMENKSAEGAVAGEPAKAESTKKSGKKRGKKGSRKQGKKRANTEQHESHEHESHHHKAAHEHETGAQKKIDEETEVQEGHR